MKPIPQQARAAGDAITAESVAIIRSRLGSWTGPAGLKDLVIRVAHTTGDVDYARGLLCSQHALDRGIAAVRRGCTILTDVTMVVAGIRQHRLHTWGCQARCLLDEAEAVQEAADLGLTRSAAAIRLAARRGLLAGSILAVGNAPTALFELLALAQDGGPRPALVVGIPVGFVGAAESKEELAASDLEYLTILGERGGSPIAAALVNGIVALASGNGQW